METDRLTAEAFINEVMTKDGVVYGYGHLTAITLAQMLEDFAAKREAEQAARITELESDAMGVAAAIAADRGRDADRTIREQAAEIERLRGALEDMRDHGIRFDLQPTMNHKSGPHDEHYQKYLTRIDESIRQRARTALGKEERT